MTTAAKYPHCDQYMLHAPGKCQFCDDFPEDQIYRSMWAVNFTGETVPGLLPCPSGWKKYANIKSVQTHK